MVSCASLHFAFDKPDAAYVTRLLLTIEKWHIGLGDTEDNLGELPRASLRCWCTYVGLERFSTA